MLTNTDNLRDVRYNTLFRYTYTLFHLVKDQKYICTQMQKAAFCL